MGYVSVEGLSDQYQEKSNTVLPCATWLPWNPKATTMLAATPARVLLALLATAASLVSASDEKLVGPINIGGGVSLRLHSLDLQPQRGAGPERSCRLQAVVSVHANASDQTKQLHSSMPAIRRRVRLRFSTQLFSARWSILQQLVVFFSARVLVEQAMQLHSSALACSECSDRRE